MIIKIVLILILLLILAVPIVFLIEDIFNVTIITDEIFKNIEILFVVIYGLIAIVVVVAIGAYF